MQPKPKLVLFPYKYSTNLPDFVRMHRQHQVKCLSESFEVVIVQGDCDYEQACAEHRPDLALFEMLGDNDIVAARKPVIKNVAKVQTIPKVALINADSFSGAWAGFISDMERWGIETAFSICTTAAEHIPEIADNVFAWPNYVDTEIYRDYGQPKVIPVLFTGATSEAYPWRREIYKVVSEVYPSLRCPHHGYTSRITSFRMMYGEAYARTINASWVVPACGTVAMEVLRKHFEIPACKACLITESSPGLVAAGFRDMKNCVFANADDILEKLDYLFQHPEEIERITAAGHQLVHSRHTYKQRDQIYQWFMLHKSLKPGQKIVQPNLFEPPIVVEESYALSDSRVSSNGVHLTLFSQGEAKLWAREYFQARALFVRSSNYVPWGLPKAKFHMALCDLYMGNANAAYAWLITSVHYILARYHAIDPDPVEWAYCIIALLALGKWKMGRECASQFPALRHPELDRARWAAYSLALPGRLVPVPQDETATYRRSIHQLPVRSLSEWIEEVCLILHACGQSEYAKVLARRGDAEAVSLRGVIPGSSCIPAGYWPKPVFGFRVKAVFMNLHFRGICARLAKEMTGLLHRVEAKFGF
jgi:hypothetical protein